MPAAFPGAYGHGAAAVGGRGGTVIHVANLNGSGAGSLREALTTATPRHVVFDVGGEIDLGGSVDCAPYLTVAGQTAPGDGITIRGGACNLSYETIWRYTRHRGQSGEYNTSAFRIYSDAPAPYNIIIDHISAAWWTNDIIDIWYNTPADDDIRNITVQNSLLAEPPWSHPTGANVGGDLSGTAYHDRVHHITFYNDLWVEVGWRHPNTQGFDMEIINNYVYNWGNRCHSFAQGVAGANLDFVKNYYDKGPMTNANARIFLWWPYPAGSETFYDPSVYVKGNLAPGHGLTDEDADNWPYVLKSDSPGWIPAPTGIKRTTRATLPTYPCPEIATGSIWARMKPHVGASQRLTSEGNWVSMRDSLDDGWIADVVDQVGESDNSNTTFGTIPSHDAGTAYTDTDGDGMADDWEDLHGLDKNSSADQNGTAAGNGYTNIENFLNGIPILALGGPASL